VDGALESRNEMKSKVLERVVGKDEVDMPDQSNLQNVWCCLYDYLVPHRHKVYSVVKLPRVSVKRCSNRNSDSGDPRSPPLASRVIKGRLPFLLVTAIAITSCQIAP
jgi:hypothetical protein